MELNIYKDYQALSFHAAETILETVHANPKAVLCLATGNSPRLTYEIVTKKATVKNIDFTQCTFIALDEWVGIPPSSEGSCSFFLNQHLFFPLKIAPSQVHLFDAMSPDPEAECTKMDQVIADKNGIDLMLVGVGMNGHIGFNEPGVSPDKFTHVINLDDITQSVGQQYFPNTVVIKQGITLGLKHVLQSRKLIMMANGSQKAGIMQKALEGPLSNQVPASILRVHSNIRVMLEHDSASLLNNYNYV